MPLLPLEKFIFPDDLLAQPVRPARSEASWWVLHCRPRAEKSLIRRILPHQLSFFLPLYKHQWCSRGRRLVSYLPLFPGYMFLHGDPLARLLCQQTNLLVRILPVSDQEELEDDLLRVYRFMTSGLPLTPEERMAPGDPVLVTAGPLAGLQGKVLRHGNQLKLWIEVEFLQRGVSAEVESWMVQPIGKSSRGVMLDAAIAGSSADRNPVS